MLLSALIGNRAEILLNGRSLDATVQRQSTYVQFTTQSTVFRVDDAEVTAHLGRTPPLKALASDQSRTTQCLIQVQEPSDSHWLDPIIREQAKHYGLSVDKFNRLMHGAATFQETLDKV